MANHQHPNPEAGTDPSSEVGFHSPPGHHLQIWTEGDYIRVAFPNEPGRRTLKLPINGDSLAALVNIMTERERQPKSAIAEDAAPTQDQLRWLPGYTESVAEAAAKADAKRQAEAERRARAEAKKMAEFHAERLSTMTSEQLFEEFFGGQS